MTDLYIIEGIDVHDADGHHWSRPVPRKASRSDVLEWLVSDKKSLLELRKGLREHGFEEGLRAALITAMKAISGGTCKTCAVAAGYLEPESAHCPECGGVR